MKVAFGVRRRHAFESIRQPARERSIEICQSGHEGPAKVGDVPRDAVTASRG
uniref:Uncharacterized protein n=1 Tax=Streptomyces sp. NBC_00180 TaxID=2903632 RepID=A0AAU1HUA2_9ACTN